MGQSADPVELGVVRQAPRPHRRHLAPRLLDGFLPPVAHQDVAAQQMPRLPLDEDDLTRLQFGLRRIAGPELAPAQLNHRLHLLRRLGTDRRRNFPSVEATGSWRLVSPLRNDDTTSLQTRRPSRLALRL